MSDTDIEKQFQAAVQVIQSLPKSGHYKPSDELRLKFYAHYKQATEGPNTTKRPGILDFVGKYKWDAWTQMADMSRLDAMKGYVQVFIGSLADMVLTDGDVDVMDKLVPFKEHLPGESQLVLAKHNL